MQSTERAQLALEDHVFEPGAPMDLPNDKKVKTWAEFVAALYDIPLMKHKRYRSNFVYRGVADKNWKLETSLRRLGPAYSTVEGPLLRNFIKYAQVGDVSGQSLLFRLAVAQHHGLPTRLLDWSVAPKVAAHFATCEEEHYDKDAARRPFKVERSRMAKRRLRSAQDSTGQSSPPIEKECLWRSIGNRRLLVARTHGLQGMERVRRIKLERIEDEFISRARLDVIFRQYVRWKIFQVLGDDDACGFSAIRCSDHSALISAVQTAR